MRKGIREIKGTKVFKGHRGIKEIRAIKETKETQGLKDLKVSKGLLVRILLFPVHRVTTEDLDLKAIQERRDLKVIKAFLDKTRMSITERVHLLTPQGFRTVRCSYAM